jgi:hypothetical protein
MTTVEAGIYNRRFVPCVSVLKKKIYVNITAENTLVGTATDWGQNFM